NKQKSILPNKRESILPNKQESIPQNKQIISKTPKNNLNVIIDEIINIYEKKKILNYFNNHNVTLDEIYNWLLNNQDNSNFIVVLGRFNFLGIETSVNKQKAFEL